MPKRQPEQSPQPAMPGRPRDTPHSQRNTGEGADSALALMKGHRRVEDLVNRQLPPEGEAPDPAQP